MEAIPEAGALVQWRREVSEGLRTKLSSDLLWLAAVHEAQGRDYERQGLIDAANEARRQAARLVLQQVVQAETV